MFPSLLALALHLAAPARAAIGAPDAQAILQIEAMRLPPRALAPYLEHPDAATRARAARALGRLRDVAALAGLRRLVLDPDPAVRAEAAFALGQTPGALPVLLNRYDLEDDSLVRARLLEAMGKEGDRTAVPVLLSALYAPPRLAPSPEPEAAAVALGRLGMRDVPGARDPTVQKALLDCLDRFHKPLRRGAAFALARGGATTLPAPSRARLLELAAGDWDPVVRANLVRAAAGLNLEAAEVDALLGTAAADHEATVRIAAARAAARLAWTPVVALLADPEVGVRREAITAVGAITSLEPAELLQPIVDAGADMGAAEAQASAGDPRMLLASTAIRALALRQRLSEVESLLALDRPTEIRAAAVEALRDPARLARLAAEDPEGPVRTAAAQALTELKASHDLLLPLLDAFDPIVAAIVAEHLTSHPAPRSERQLLSALLESDSPDLLRASALALTARFKGHPNPPIRKDAALQATLLRLSAHPDAGVREAAEVLRAALGLPAPPRSHSLLSAPLDELARIQGARVTTSRGEVRFALLAEDAPLTVWNFAWLADQGFYDNLKIHRVVPDFVVQDGDPRGDGFGGPGWSIPDEINPVHYDEGTIGMALSGPDTGGSQWFATLSPQPHLDGGYTVFGRVTAGMAVLKAMQPGDRILHVEIERSPAPEPAQEEAVTEETAAVEQR